MLDAQTADLATLVTRRGDEHLAELLARLDPSDAARLIGKLSRTQAADVLEAMAPDDAANVVEELEPHEAKAILVEMKPAEAADLRELLAYPPESAGRLMTPEFVSISPDLTAEQALLALHAVAEAAETSYSIYVTEPATDRLLGVLSLRHLVLSRPTTPVGEVMIPDVVKVRVDADREEAARLLEQHHLLALPVVDPEDRLRGILTATDAAKVLREEAGEDMEQLGGSDPLEAPYLRSGMFSLVKKRVRWLLLLFLAEAYTGTVLRAFEDELQRVVALTFFIPLLIGTGGNTGTQITTTLTRALAVGEVRPGDVLRVLRKEWGVAGVLGAVMAVASWIRAWTLGVAPPVGLVVAATAGCIVLWAGTVAALLPLAQPRLGLDPAVVSGPFITTIVDGTGLVIYFELARYMLHL